MLSDMFAVKCERKRLHLVHNAADAVVAICLHKNVASKYYSHIDIHQMLIFDFALWSH